MVLSKRASSSQCQDPSFSAAGWGHTSFTSPPLSHTVQTRLSRSNTLGIVDSHTVTNISSGFTVPLSLPRCQGSLSDREATRRLVVARVGKLGIADGVLPQSSKHKAYDCKARDVAIDMFTVTFELHSELFHKSYLQRSHCIDQSNVRSSAVRTAADRSAKLLC